MIKMNMYLMIIELVAIISVCSICFVLFLTKSNKNRLWLIGVLLCNALILIANEVIYYDLDFEREPSKYIFILKYFSVALSSIIAIYYHQRKRKLWLNIFNFVFLLLLSAFLFFIGDFNNMSLFIEGLNSTKINIILLAIAILIIANFSFLFIYKEYKKSKIFTLIMHPVLMILGLAFDYLLHYRSTFLLFLLADVYLIIEFYLEDNKLFYDQNVSLINANVSLMISQIQPHFLYNALGAISEKVRSDPKTASDAIEDFAFYLRGNIDSLSNKLISIKEEIEHTKYYLSLEKLRFGKKINVIYELSDDEFMIPPLSLEPIVENAIKHGLSKKLDGGTLIIKSYKDNKNYYIEVKDDGIGFDINKKYDDSKHIGLKNVKQRLDVLLGGNVTIESKQGYGTVAIISIPIKGGIKK